MSEEAPIGQCFNCGGSGVIGEAGAVACPLCKGLGTIGDSGPAPEVHVGLCSFKPCGCARDWIGAGASPEWRANRIALWQEQGFTWSEMSFSEAAPLLTLGDACRHDPRSSPRDSSPVLDLSNLPPGGGAPPDRPRVIAVQIHHHAEDERGSITHIILTADLDDDTHRECEVALPPAWTGPEKT